MLADVVVVDGSPLGVFEGGDAPEEWPCVWVCAVMGVVEAVPVI